MGFKTGRPDFTACACAPGVSKGNLGILNEY